MTDGSAPQHADGRRLAGAIAAEEAEVSRPGVREAEVVDGDERAEPARELPDLDRVHLPSARASSASANRTLAMARVRSSSACSSTTSASSTSV